MRYWRTSPLISWENGVRVNWWRLIHALGPLGDPPLRFPSRHRNVSSRGPQGRKWRVPFASLFQPASPAQLYVGISLGICVILLLGRLIAGHPQKGAARLRRLNADITPAAMNPHSFLLPSAEEDPPPVTMLQGDNSRSNRLRLCSNGDMFQEVSEELLESARAYAPPVRYVEDLHTLPEGCEPPQGLDEADTDPEVEQLHREMLCRRQDARDSLGRHPAFQPVNIGISTQLNKISYADIPSGTWGVYVTQWYLWYDYRLLYNGTEICRRWDPFTDFVQMPIDRMVLSSVWSPDIFTLNAADVDTWAGCVGRMEEARVYDFEFYRQFGYNVAWRSTLTVRAVCDFDLSRFPFDEQVCSGIWGPMAHESFYARMIPRIFPLQNNHTISSADWNHRSSAYVFEQFGASIDLRILNHELSVRNSPINPSAERVNLLDEHVPSIELMVHFRREGTFYLMNFVLPMTTMWLLAYTTFFLPFEEHDRLEIITAVVWTTTTIMFLTAATRPVNFIDAWIDMFQAGSLVLCVFPAMEAVLVSRLQTHIQERLDQIRATYELSKAKYKTKMRQVHLQDLQVEFLRKEAGVFTADIGAEKLQSTAVPGEALLSGTLDGDQPAIATDPSTVYASGHRVWIPSSIFGSSEADKSTTASEWDEYDAFIPPPPPETDSSALSNFIDRACQICYPGVALAFVTSRFGTLRLNSTVARLTTLQFATGASNATQILGVVVLCTFCSLWLLAIISYMLKLFPRRFSYLDAGTREHEE